MSTRSVIARENEDGSLDAIYCHSDGYLSHNGRILLEHYRDPGKVSALIALGSISSLAEEIGEKHSFDDYEAHRNWVRAYHRDRGEELQAADRYSKRGLNGKVCSDRYGAEYAYLFGLGRRMEICQGERKRHAQVEAADSESDRRRRGLTPAPGRTPRPAGFTQGMPLGGGE